MSRKIAAALLGLTVLWNSPRQAAGADELRLLVISIDGLRGEWASHPERNGLKLPTLRKLAERGVCADGVRGVFPSVTYPSHTTLITGCLPAKHGILANNVFDPPTEKQTERWFWNYSDIRVPTIIDAAKKAGWSTASVGWPVNVDAPVDVLFPEVWEPGKHDEAMVAMSAGCKPPDLVAHVLTRYDLRGGAEHDVNRANVARHIVDRYKPRLMLVHLIELDHQEHSHGPDSKQARDAAEEMDRYVGDILQQYEKNGLLDQTVVAIVSDHGFLPTEKSFHINVLLRDAGLITAGASGKGPASDWQATGWVAGGSCAIMLKKPGDAAALKRVRESLAPYVGKADSPVRRVVERDEIEKLGANTRAAIMLDAGDGFTFSPGLIGKNVVSESKNVKGMHGQMPDRPGLQAAFIAAGPGIAKGKTLGAIRMIDIAPTLAGAVGLTLPAAEGKAILGVPAHVGK